MPRRHSLDRYPEVKEYAVKEYERGKTIRELEQEIKIKFPQAQASRSSIHRLIRKLKPLLELKRSGLLSDEDLDTFQQSQTLATIATGLLLEVIAEWQEKGEVEDAKIDALMRLVHTASNLSRSSAYIEKTKTQLIEHTEKVLEKVAKTLAKHLDEDLAKRIIAELKHEL